MVLKGTDSSSAATLPPFEVNEVNGEELRTVWNQLHLQQSNALAARLNFMTYFLVIIKIKVRLLQSLSAQVPSWANASSLSIRNSLDSNQKRNEIVATCRFH